MREPLIVLDVDLKILRANQAFYKNFKTRPEETEGRSLKELGAAQWNLPQLHDALGAVIMRNTVLNNYQLQFTTDPGTAPRTLRVNARKIPGDRERAELILLAIDDVTERMANVDQLRDSSQRKDEFLAMLAHELRNPLSPISNAIQLLRRGVSEASAVKLYDLIERQTMRLVRLVDELLDVARISRGHMELKRAQVDLAEVALHAAEASRPRIEARQQLLTLSLPKEPVCVDGDAVRLEQIISNLLENAAKYTEPGGRIELKLTEERGEALLCVRDNGIGLAPENLEAIFDLFRQVDSSLARSGGGLGIGLTLVRRVLEMHGGQIEARSAGLGHGTEFLVRLPVVPAKPSSSSNTHAEAGAAQQSVSVRRVLIVDDNVDSAESLAQLVRTWGHEVVVAADGPSALQLAEQFHPEHALLDIGLPGMNGYELARRLREQNGDGDLQLVAMTGYGREEDRASARTAGFDAHLVKPADLNQLERLLGHGGVNRRRMTLQSDLPAAAGVLSPHG